MPELKPYMGDYYLWHYLPSRIAAGTIAGSFLVLTLWATWRTIRSQIKFTIPFIIGGILEIIGYLARIWAAYHTESLIPYSVQAVLILIAPALLCASIYIALSRVIRSINAHHHSFIGVAWLTRIFVLADLLSLCVQSAGSSLQSIQDFNPDIGKTVVVVGLVIQILGLGLFIITAVTFDVRIRRKPTNASRSPESRHARIIVMLYFVNGLIMARSIFRVVEFSMGPHGYLFEYEWPLYTFDGELMLLAMFCFTCWFPGRLGSTSTVFEAIGTTEDAPQYISLSAQNGVGVMKAT